jgi:cellulose synthase/poly-beta-1,6-N-acetylglucosamine synthase-like glycosyltransferase
VLPAVVDGARGATVVGLPIVHLTFVTLYTAMQVTYFIVLLAVGWLFTRRIRWAPDADPSLPPEECPPILLFYPVLNEAEETMRTTFLALSRMDYPAGKLRLVSIPNHNDPDTIAALERLAEEFDFLEVLPVPPTSDPAWQPVWDAWDANPKVYWWHVGPHAGVRDLPPKKTRQLVFAFYSLARGLGDEWLLSYLDADSAPPPEYCLIAATGMREFDVIQLTNVAGNLMESWAASFHAMDHLAWDACLYAHLSDPTQPFWVLGKGLFFRVRDLVDYGGFHPWLTIEDPEVGMRLWTNGCRLGVSRVPLIEEVPNSYKAGVTQRKRWVCGFFQSLASPLALMGMTWSQRLRARLIVVPCVSLSLNAIGLPVGLVVLVGVVMGWIHLAWWMDGLSITTMSFAFSVMVRGMVSAWVHARPVLPSRRGRLLFLLRVNPVFLLAYWFAWTLPLAKGLEMFLHGGGLVWERTPKNNANNDLVRERAPVTGLAPEELAADVHPAHLSGQTPRSLSVSEPATAGRPAG